MDIINAKPAFDAEQATIDRAVRRGSDANHSTVFDIQVKIASDATEWAGRSHLFVRSPRLAEHFFCQGSDRAGGDTGAAEHAIGFMCSAVKGRREFGVETATGKIEHVADLQFLASTNAASAQDAFFIISHNERIAVVNLIMAAFSVEADFFNSQFCGKFL